MYCHKLNYDFSPLIDMSVITTDGFSPSAGLSTSLIPIELCNPVLLDLLESKGLVLTAIRSFVKAPKTGGGIHIDSPFTGKSRCRLNWVNDATPSYMVWYDIDDSVPAQQSVLENDSSAYRIFKGGKLKCFEKLNGWFLVETAIAHKVVNSSNVDRICLSFFVQKDERIPTMNELKEIMPL